MKKTIALLSCCLLTFALLQANPALAGAGCCPKGEKAEKAACAPKACSGDQAMTKSCVVDGKTVTCTVNADGSCTMPAGAVQVTEGATTKTCVVDGKSVSCKVNADGTCTVAAAESCHGAKAACGDKKACNKSDKKACDKSDKKDKKAGI
jgi:hypothetical protein